MTASLLYDSANSTCAFAAEELARHLAMLPGAAFTGPVRLAVQPDLSRYGLPAAQSPFDDRYAFSVTAAGGEILGANARSVLLGVYAYLRRVGFCFLRPGPQGTHVPTFAGPEQLAAQDACAAFVRHRGVCIEGSNSPENILDFVDWLPKVGYNSFFMQFKTPYVFLERWYHHTLNPLAAPEAMDDALLAQADRRVTEAMQLRGLMHHRVGHGWTTDAMGVNSTGWYEIGPAPEAVRPLLAEVNGKRDFFGGVPTNTNLCYSNPQARSRFVAAVANYAEAHPEVDVLHVWLADYFNNICECPACRQTTPSDQYVQLLNELDAELTARGLCDTRIVFLLYQELLLAPVQARLAHPERFILMFAPISRTFRQSYPVEFEPAPLPPYVRNRFELPTRVEENLTCLRQWQGVFRGDSFDYDYPLGRAHYGDFGYVHIARVIAQDVRALPALGLNGYISCQELRVLCPSALPNYVMGLMLLDGRAEFDALCREYFAAAYGPADGAQVLAYLSQLSALSDCDYFNGKGPRQDTACAARMDRLIETLDQFAPVIAGHCAGTGPALPWWQLLQYHAGYTRLLALALQALALGRSDEARRRFEAFQQEICAHEPEWQPVLDVYRIQEVALHYTGFGALQG